MWSNHSEVMQGSQAPQNDVWKTFSPECSACLLIGISIGASFFTSLYCIKQQHSYPSSGRVVLSLLWGFHIIFSLSCILWKCTITLPSLKEYTWRVLQPVYKEGSEIWSGSTRFGRVLGASRILPPHSSHLSILLLLGSAWHLELYLMGLRLPGLCKYSF